MYKILLSVISIGIVFSSLTGCKESIDEYTEIKKAPQIFPDYTSLVIPANIAPLNFNINEEGTDYLVEISSKNGDKITIRQSSSKIEIPVKKWKNILGSNKAMLYELIFWLNATNGTNMLQL